MKAMKTYSTKPSHVEPRWHVFDASDKVLGRLATEVSVLLQGKHKPMYAAHVLTGDFVIVVNASRIKVTGNKLDQKIYRSHSNYPGALRETPMSKMQANYPDRIIREAVRGMLPKTVLGRQMLRRLKIYAEDSHPHGAQISDMSRDEVVAEPAKTERPTTPEAVEQPIDEVVEEPTQAEAEASEQPADEVVEEPTQAEAEASEQPADEVVEEPTQAEEASEQPADEVVEEPTQAEASEQPTGEGASGEPAENEKVEN